MSFHLSTSGSHLLQTFCICGHLALDSVWFSRRYFIFIFLVFGSARGVSAHGYSTVNPN